MMVVVEKRRSIPENIVHRGVFLSPATTPQGATLAVLSEELLTRQEWQKTLMPKPDTVTLLSSEPPWY